MTDPYACQLEESPTEVCVVCPEVPFVAAVPARTLTDRLLGWNASALSRRRIEGDAFVEFDVPNVTGTLVGLVTARRGHDPRDVAHGLLFFAAAGAYWWTVAEAGVQKLARAAHVASDRFRIERRGSTVSYFRNGKLVYTSGAPLAGSVVVQSCLYAAGDGVN